MKGKVSLFPVQCGVVLRTGDLTRRETQSGQCATGAATVRERVRMQQRQQVAGPALTLRPPVAVRDNICVAAGV